MTGYGPQLGPDITFLGVRVVTWTTRRRMPTRTS